MRRGVLRQHGEGGRGLRDDVDHANARFDLFLKGDATAINDVEKKGLRLFIDKGCAGCHGGVNLGGAAYFPFGVAQTPAS